MRKAFLLAVLCVCGNAFALAETEHHAPATAPKHEEAAEMHLSYPHPTLPEDARWAGAMTLIILGMFALAAGVGVTVYVNAPPEEHSAHGHDDHSGAHGHDHGAGGHHH